jgi:2-oxoglutarate dehydrogenase E1 component
VNGDDVEAVVHAMRFAMEYRQHFGRDVFIDLLCYRKYGHNEGDEPRFTQPLLYKAIARHPNPREIYHAKLLAQGATHANMVKELEAEFKQLLEGHFDEAKQIAKNVIVPFMEDEWAPYPPAAGDAMLQLPQTGAERNLLEAAATALTTLPEGKKFLNKATRLLEDRRAMVFERNAIDWGMAENLAYATLLQEGFSVRISGEDVERGTFSHRHAVLKMEDSEEEYIPMNAVPGKKGRFAIYNSHLSEYAVLGFDYGYAMASPETLVIWEAQFGDFANGAQIIIDQFISAAEDKWNTQNGLLMLLPHGYEGQGAEHSSARLERFLQLCAEDNMAVCNPTTPANHFHLLRRSMHWSFRKPVVVMSPKSLLRHPKAVSTVEELSAGTFQPLIGDTTVKPADVKKVVFCSGKLYYELDDERTKRGATDTAIVRLEQIYPLPAAQMHAELAKYPSEVQLVWAQEEPANMGAWTFMLANCDLKLHRVSPPASAAPATGSHKAAHQIQHRLIAETFDC